MALAHRHRLVLHEAFTSIAGEEASEALLAEFPSYDNDELVTKAFLRAELADLRTELHDEISNLRTELHIEIGNLRTELHDEISNLRTELHDEIGNLRTELHDEIGNLRTELHQETSSIRADMARLEATISNRLRSQTVWMCSAMFLVLGITKVFG